MAKYKKYYQDEYDSIFSLIQESGGDETVLSTLLPMLESAEIKLNISSCQKCNISKLCNAPVPFSIKYTDKDFRIIGILESPGKFEDGESDPVAGQNGQLLTSTITRVGLSIDGFLNTVCCRTPESRSATREEIRSCRSNLVSQIEFVKPWLIVCFGAVPLQSMSRKLKITKDHGVFFRAKLIPDSEETYLCVGAYSPGYVISNSRIKSEESKKICQEWICDLKHISQVVECREMFGSEVMLESERISIIECPYIQDDPERTKEGKKTYLQKMDDKENEYSYGGCFE